MEELRIEDLQKRITLAMQVKYEMENSIAYLESTDTIYKTDDILASIRILKKKYKDVCQQLQYLTVLADAKEENKMRK